MRVDSQGESLLLSMSRRSVGSNPRDDMNDFLNSIGKVLFGNWGRESEGYEGEGSEFEGSAVAGRQWEF